MKAISIYITCKNKLEARKISRVLLNKKLIACANIFPVESLYLWRGKLEKSGEVAAVFKTLKKNLAQIKKEIKKLHSYQTPVIEVFEVDLNKESFKWLKEELIS